MNINTFQQFKTTNTTFAKTRPDTRPPVADGWAGAELRVFPLFDSITSTDQPTDRPTNRPTDQRTDKASYRVACPQLKNEKKKKNKKKQKKISILRVMKTRPTPISRVRDLQGKNDLE